MSSNASPGTRILGSLRSADGAGVVRIEDRYDTDIDVLVLEVRGMPLELVPPYQDLAANIS
jgi:hypothetical protein